MLTQWLTPQHIRVIDDVSDWQEAVRLSAEPLLAEGQLPGLPGCDLYVAR